MNNKIIIINGPNLNLLGEREQSQYGSKTFNELEKECLNKSKEIGLTTDFVQSNIEGEIVNLIQSSRSKYSGLIINAAGYTHTSVSILDALLVLKIPIIELHITNIYNREDFRHKSLISKAATGIICGFGEDGYVLAIEAMIKLIYSKE